MTSKERISCFSKSVSFDWLSTYPITDKSILTSTWDQENNFYFLNDNKQKKEAVLLQNQSKIEKQTTFVELKKISTVKNRTDNEVKSISRSKYGVVKNIYHADVKIFIKTLLTLSPPKFFNREKLFFSINLFYFNSK